MTYSKGNIIEKYSLAVSLAGSLLLHLTLVIAALVIKFNDNNYNHTGYTTIAYIKSVSEDIEKISSNDNKNILNSDEKSDKPDESNDKIFQTKFLKIEEAGFDSTSLEHIYKEPTLNVRLKYPVGWTYIDQQKSSRLDGVTFWSVSNDINPPPYVNIEVVEKYLFNPARFAYRYNFRNFEGYYNVPEEIEGQVSQQIYLRTNDDEDFVIKLIVNGRENFNKFQPVFFAMINSFRFGNSVFF